MLDKRYRYWVFTLNNPVMPMADPPISVEKWRTKPRYMIYQLEEGENGTPHLQGYVAFQNPVRGRTLSKCLGGNPHLEDRRGTHLEVSPKKNANLRKFFFFFFSSGERLLPEG